MNSSISFLYFIADDTDKNFEIKVILTRHSLQVVYSSQLHLEKN